MKHQFDVVVVGGGHAGTEAAAAAWRRGASVALVTLKSSDLGVMSCNPAIGGIGKGHLVREIDALGGLMGEAADYAGIQFRLLNRRKGPAVRGPRVQADRKRYAQFVQAKIAEMTGLMVIEQMVSSLTIDDDHIFGVVLADGSELCCKTVVLTTGTFLRGRTFEGDVVRSEGRKGDSAVVSLADQIRNLGLKIGRLKTGTPPRLAHNSIDWDQVGEQWGDTSPFFMSEMTNRLACEQVYCGVTETNHLTHEIVEQNIKQSAVYGGRTDGVGPRYCPSLEDKVARFSEKSSHQIYLEPEGLGSELVYPNGISTSLPAAVQDKFVRTIRGLEDVRIEQYGYAVEYDFVDPRSLTSDLELSNINGLFLAGQINGTTGYEEAAAQGLVAGTNAAGQALGSAGLSIARNEGYIGVLIDDLTTLGVNEPYRMFTSRAEYRLALRADNADRRLTEKGRELGLVDDCRWATFRKKQMRLELLAGELKAWKVSPSQQRECGADIRQDAPSVNGLAVLGLRGVEARKVAQFFEKRAVTVGDLELLQADVIYAPYLQRQEKQVAALVRDSHTQLAHISDYGSVPGLSNELSEKLNASRPETLAQAARIEGMTPSALTLLLGMAKKRAAS